MNKTLVFIDDGFLSKLSKHFGNGKYLKLHRKKFSTSNELLKSCSRFVKLNPEDFE